jgi:type I restriction enzyme R subunit
VETEEDWILKQVESRRQPENLSYFAFTATPKPQTIERFGTKQSDGSYRPFSLYSMKQAIDEHFILDVLKNYTTYKTYFKIIQADKEDPEVPRNRALSTIIRYVNLHEVTIEQKVEIMVAHFENTVRDLMDGRSKTMVVTRSRESAVRYKLAFDTYLKEKGYAYKTLVAFTDSIKIDGTSHTETSMNGGIPESNTAEEFKKPQYKFLIVAEKYQTGFDQPLLCAMYVDKTLSGVQAVQTLSRLNRTASDKNDVFVLDFVNNTDDIKDAFDPYYTTTILSEGTDVNTLNDLRRDIFNLYKIPAEALDEFALLLSKNNENIHDSANGLLDKFVDDITRLDEEAYIKFKSKIYHYTKSYPFISQILNYSDVSHEKLYLFLKYLIKKLPKDTTGGPLDILDLIDLEDIRVVKKIVGSIPLDEGESDIVEIVDGGTGEKIEEDIDVLSEVIKAVNKQWGAEFGEKQQETLTKMAEDLASDEEFEHVVKNSSKHGSSLKFEGAFKNKYDDQFENDYKLWEQLTNNPDLRKYVRTKMFDYVLEKMKK